MIAAERLDLRACFFGDSFVAGVGDPTGLGWVGRVSSAARASGIHLTSYNLGVRGQTSCQVVARVPLESPARLGDAEDPRLILSFGVNDTTVRNGRTRVSIEDGVRAIRSLVESAPDVARVFLVGPPAVVDPRQNKLVAARDEAFRKESERLGIRFVSVFRQTMQDSTWQREVAAGDGFHPDEAGYDLLAGLIGPPLVGWLASEG